MPNLISLINQVVNNHTVIAKAKSRNTHTYWVIKCNNCGKTREVQGTHIRNACFSPCSCSAGKEQRICPICNKGYEVNISSASGSSHVSVSAPMVIRLFFSNDLTDSHLVITLG